MSLLEKKLVQLDDSVMSISYEGVPLPDEYSIFDRFEFYRKKADQRQETEGFLFGPESLSGVKKE